MEENHHCKYTALHDEYKQNRVHYDPVLGDNESMPKTEGKALGLIDVQSLVHYDDYDFPSEDTITSTEYPEQDEEYLGETFALWYMLQNSVHEKEYGLFKVVRWDAEDPGIVMLVNDSKKLLLVSPPEYVLDDGTEEDDELGRKVYNSHVHYYPVQMDELLGLDVRDMYFKDPDFNYGIIIRADAGGEHPQYVVLETLADDSYRLITFKEAKSITSMYKIDPSNSKKDYWPSDWRNLNYEEDADDTDGGEGTTDPD